uniref:Endoplasmic reticulum membrane-associated RNA degradation protein-like n=1 Tax=Phallusia mammillata TaxID=59560 RepID=A0A6F9DBG9_9ASCI|nr:endoplasmic reticulum membrane-associated RNA degradation protein-like [Phallusia mammillata]
MTFLSNAVVHLFHVISTKRDVESITETTSLACLKNNLSLFVKTNCVCLMQTELNSPDDFIAALIQLKPAFESISQFDFASGKPCKGIKNLRADVLQTLNNGWEVFVTEDALQIVVTLLQITSHLERTLGDVFLVKGKVCPFLLRDLLASPELSEICLPWRMKMMQLLLGGPFSLNLRNLLWHGFVAPEEISIGCAKMMFACVYDLYCYLEETNIYDRIRLRPLVKINTSTNIINKLFPVKLIEEDITQIKAYFETSLYIAKVMLPYFLHSVSCYENKKLDICVITLLPQLETLLRCQFASCNNMPERVMTAQSTEFYTTMDEILAEHLPSGKENQLKHFFDKQFMVLLTDIFNQPEGLRLRDRLSHGELDTDDVTQYVADLIIFVVTYASHRPLKFNDDGLCKERFDFCPNSCICYNSSWYSNASLKISNYESVFHPLAVAKRLSNECLDLCDQFQTLVETVKFEDDGNSASCNETCDRVYENCARLFESHFHEELNTCDVCDVLPRIKAVRRKKLETLHRSDSKSLEASAFLRQIAKNSLNAAQNLLSSTRSRAEDLRAKRLRSRQRQNFQKLIACYPVITSGLKFHCCAVFIFIHHRFDAERLAALRRDFKTLLRISEKLVTFTSADVNKWDDAVSLISQLSQLFR